MAGKKNYRNIADCEKELFRINKLLAEHKLKPAEAQAMARVCDSWIKARKSANSDELMRRLDGLEALAKAQQKARQGPSANIMPLLNGLMYWSGS